ncbi:MAG: hypothetical protein IT487_11995 [Chromatiaceae bacterium]|nr:hypothetical protein [Chromatiaceae bacterium]
MVWLKKGRQMATDWENPRRRLRRCGGMASEQYLDPDPPGRQAGKDDRKDLPNQAVFRPKS